jgi:EPS-associated MarR family transcriptional regulator
MNHATVSSELQLRVLRLLESNLLLTQRELSRYLRVSLRGVNYCLNALVAKGSVKIQNFKNNKNNWAYTYLLTHQCMLEETVLTGSFLKRKMRQYQELKKD